LLLKRADAVVIELITLVGHVPAVKRHCELRQVALRIVVLQPRSLDKGILQGHRVLLATILWRRLSWRLPNEPFGQQLCVLALRRSSVVACAVWAPRLRPRRVWAGLDHVSLGFSSKAAVRGLDAISASISTRISSRFTFTPKKGM